MELKMNEYQLPEKLAFNYEELKATLLEEVSADKTAVITEDQIKFGKERKAKLNKLRKAMNDERIRLEKEYMVPFNDFKGKIAELVGIVDEATANIDKQLKEFEVKQKQDKKDEIENFFASCLHPEWLKFEQIFNEKWLNASVSMKSIQGEIDSRLEQVANDLATLQNLPEFGFEATEIYKSTLDLNKALNEGRRLSEIAKAKAAHEAEMQARAEEKALMDAEAKRIREEAKFAEAMNPPVEEVAATEEVVVPPATPAKQWVTFAAHLTTEDALALKAFFEERHIEFKAV